MTKYATRVRAHWEQYAPSHMKMLLDSRQDLTAFFLEIGADLQGEVSSLMEDMTAVLLAERPEARDNYLQTVAVMTTARKIAEEIAMTHQLAWVKDPSLNLAEARQEWEDTRPMDDGLLTLAYQIQDSKYPMYSTEELEEIAKNWAVPMWFLDGLIQSENPSQYLTEHHAVMEEAATMRFLREVH